MFQKLHGKLLSIVLCIAICCATLCGSLIAAHAAAADFNGTYTISVGDEKNAVPFAATEVKAQVTFNLDAGFVGGQFTANAQSTYTIGETATAVAVTTKDGSDFDLANVQIKSKAGENNNKIFRFVIGDGSTLCTSITIEYTLLINDYVNASGTNKYPVSITLSDDDLIQFATYDLQDVTFTGSEAYFHAHFPYYYDKSETPDNAHTVFECGCYHCDIKSNQLLPDYTLFDGAEKIHTGALGWAGITGVNVIYDEDGTFDLNVHAYSQFYTDKIFLLVTDNDGNEIMRTGTYNGAESSSLAGNAFHKDTKTFKIENLSARDIETELLFTLIAVYNESDVMTVHNSRTVPFSLADYCLKVVKGEAVWPEGTLDPQIEADKDVAAALYYYGAAIDESVFDKNTSGGGATSNIEYVNANYREWSGEKTQPSEANVDANGYIIISTPEELAWIAFDSTKSTEGKNYIVAENSVFNMMGMQNISLNSTANVVENATATGTYWYDTLNDTSNTDYGFRGSFDGNGLIVYNIMGKGAYCGLFPQIRTSVTIKNVTVKASYMQGYHGSGGIIGYADQSGQTVTISGCSVQNCYIKGSTNSGGNRSTASIVGGLGNIGLNIDSCLAVNNAYNTTSADYYGGLIGNSGVFGGAFVLSNSLSIGHSAFPLTANGKKFSTYTDTTTGDVTEAKLKTNTTWTNVYSDTALPDNAYDSAKSGITSSVPTAADLGSDWFDTASYPELSIFHKLSSQYVDENTHKVICVLKAGDNTCALEGLTEAHTLVKNAEGTAKVCECGYSVPIYKDIEYIAANYDEWDGTKVQPTATDSDGNIIINTAEELAWVALSGGSATKGTNYKVADNSVFNMNGFEGINLDSSAASVASATTTGKVWYDAGVNNWNGTNSFQGTFDGNGLIVYNLNATHSSSQQAALFPYVFYSDSYIKNVTVKASAFAAWGFTGAIVGRANDYSGGIGGHTLEISNCKTENCNFVSALTDDSYTPVASSLVGYNELYKLKISDCISNANTYDSSYYFAYGGFIGKSHTGARGSIAVENSISITSSSYPTVATGRTFNVGYDIKEASWNNVYSDTELPSDASENAIAGITQGVPTAAQLGSAWFDTETYPELSIFHTMTDEFVDETNHKPVCIITINGANCTTCGVASEHTLTKNAEKNVMECICGYYKEIIGTSITENYKKSVVWDGKTKTALTDADKDENGVYIISTAEQLAWLALSAGSSSAGNTYKVADDIGAIYINKNYDNSCFENLKATLPASSVWHTLNPATSAFQGTFDGNGATIYGYRGNDSASEGGLFPFIAGNVTFKNIKIKDSYVTGSCNIGVLSGGGNPNETSPITSITLENCVIQDNYLELQTRTSYSNGWGSVGGIVGFVGKVTESVTVENCVVCDNNIVNPGTQMTRAFFGGIVQNGVSNGSGGYTWPTQISISDSFADLPVSNSQAYASQVSYFSNVYTTVEITSGEYANGTITDNNVKVLSSTSDMQGIGAVDNMKLDSNLWFDTAEYPELHVFHDMTTITVDANTHQYVCQVFVDGVQCTTCQDAESHTMVDSEDGKSASCECGYSYEIKGIHAMGLPETILNRITSNSVYAEKFATNALFKSAYNEDVFGTQTQENVFDMYTTSLNLKVNPHIGFMFAFHGDYKANRSKITVTFTVDGETYTTEAVETSGTLGTNWVNNKGAGRYHLYRFKELPVSKLCKDVKVTVSYDGAAYDFGTYSAAGYAINAMSAGEDYQYHVNASMALVYYSEMLAARAQV